MLRFTLFIILFVSLQGCQENDPADLVINQVFPIENVYDYLYNQALEDQTNDELAKAMNAFILLHDRSYKKDSLSTAICDLCLILSRPNSPDTLHQQTLTYCADALISDEDNILYRYAIANAMVRLGEGKEALSFIGTAIDRFPNDYMLKRYRGIARTTVGDFKGAEDDLNYFISSGESNKHNHSLTWAYIDRARLFKKENKYREAVKDYNESLKRQEIGVLLVERGESIMEMLAKEKQYPFSFKDKARLKRNLCDDFRRAGELGTKSAYPLLQKYCK